MSSTPTDQSHSRIRVRRGGRGGGDHRDRALQGPDRRRDGSLDRGERRALTIYDMAKAVERGMVIGDIRLLEKRGKTGEWRRKT